MEIVVAVVESARSMIHMTERFFVLQSNNIASYLFSYSRQ